jgi:hypothetical protein
VVVVLSTGESGCDEDGGDDDGIEDHGVRCKYE